MPIIENEVFGANFIEMTLRGKRTIKKDNKNIYNYQELVIVAPSVQK